MNKKSVLKFSAIMFVIILSLSLLEIKNDNDKKDLISKCDNIFLRVGITDKSISKNLILSYKDLSSDDLKSMNKKLDFINSSIKSTELNDSQKEEFIKYVQCSLDSVKADNNKTNLQPIVPVPVFIR